MQWRSFRILTRPTVEPVTLSEAKAHCRVDTDADDGYITSLITAAREWCESYCDETFLHTKYRITFDAFPTEIELPRPPMATVGTCTAVAVTYTQSDQSTATLSTVSYRVDRESHPGVVRTLYNGSWPSHLYDYNGVAVEWWGGRGATGSDVPQRMRNAILWLVGLWYERRMAADQAGLSEIPFGVKALLDSAKWGSYR